MKTTMEIYPGNRVEKLSKKQRRIKKSISTYARKLHASEVKIVFYIHCDPESKTIDFDTDELSAMYEEVSEEPKEYYLVYIDTYFKEYVAVKAQNNFEAEAKARDLSQINFNGMNKEVYVCATCNAHTKTYAQERNYRIIEEDV